MHVNSFYPHGVKLSENSPGRGKKTSEKKKKKKSFSREFLVFLQNKHFISAFFLTLCFFFHLLSEKEKELKKIILANVFLFFFKKNLLNFFPLGFTQENVLTIFFFILLSLTYTTFLLLHVSSQFENKMKELRLSRQNSFQVKVNIFLLGSFLFHKKTH